MKGKILKISSNDLYGNVDDREVIVFACFNHKKYMNKYIIFTTNTDMSKQKLYFGSVHLKEESLVVFAVNKEIEKYIEEFTTSYLASNLDPNEYELIDISKINKIELVSSSFTKSEHLNTLYELSIPKNNSNQNNTDKTKRPKKKHTILYIILVILILSVISLTHLYLKPEDFQIEYKNLKCETTLYNNELNMRYTTNKEVTFDKSDRIKDIQVIDSYIFSSPEDYLEFKDNNQQNTYFTIDGTYKYDDDNLELKIIYKQTTIIENYDEMLGYLTKEGYTCIEGTYYE